MRERVELRCGRDVGADGRRLGGGGTQWAELAPAVREVLAAKPCMPCGAPCASCPTRGDCRLEESLGDLEDLAGLAGACTAAAAVAVA